MTQDSKLRSALTLTESGLITSPVCFVSPQPLCSRRFCSFSLHVLFTFLCLQIAAESLPVPLKTILKTPGRRKMSSNNRVEFLDNLQEKEIPGRHA